MSRVGFLRRGEITDPLRIVWNWPEDRDRLTMLVMVGVRTEAHIFRSQVGIGSESDQADVSRRRTPVNIHSQLQLLPQGQRELMSAASVHVTTADIKLWQRAQTKYIAVSHKPAHRRSDGGGVCCRQWNYTSVHMLLASQTSAALLT